MHKLPDETLDNVIGVHKTTIKACEEYPNPDYNTTLDKVIVAFLEELKEYRCLDKQGLLLKLSKQIDKDLIKAIICLASQNAYENKDECHMDLWNRTHKDEDGYVPMRCGDYEGFLCCPFYQITYGTCFEDREHEEWLRNLADMLEKSK